MEKPTFLEFLITYQNKIRNANKNDMYSTKEVEQILSKRTRGTIIEYLVKWKGYSQLVNFIVFF